jgi:hypothetical protein
LKTPFGLVICGLCNSFSIHGQSFEVLTCKACSIGLDLLKKTQLTRCSIYSQRGFARSIACGLENRFGITAYEWLGKSDNVKYFDGLFIDRLFRGLKIRQFTYLKTEDGTMFLGENISGTQTPNSTLQKLIDAGIIEYHVFDSHVNIDKSGRRWTRRLLASQSRQKVSIPVFCNSEEMVTMDKLSRVSNPIIIIKTHGVPSSFWNWVEEVTAQEMIQELVFTFDENELMLDLVTHPHQLGDWSLEASSTSTTWHTRDYPDYFESKTFISETDPEYNAVLRYKPDLADQRLEGQVLDRMNLSWISI